MPRITLDFINEAADAKYGPFVIEGVPGGDVTLLNPIRMPKEKRRQLVAMQDVANDRSADGVERALDALQDMVKLAAKTKSDADRLLKAFGGDQAKLSVLLNEYGKAAQGEAQPSPS